MDEHTADNHKKFISHLWESQEAVGKVAMWLAGQGMDVLVPRMTIAERYEDWKDHADDGDLYVISRKRIEVKRLSRDFTSEKDYPFKRIIVCAKHAWDNAKPKPVMYVHLNRQMTHCAVIKGETSGEWVAEKVTDKRYKGQDSEQMCYLCPIKHIKFRKLKGEKDATKS